MNNVEAGKAKESTQADEAAADGTIRCFLHLDPQDDRRAFGIAYRTEL